MGIPRTAIGDDDHAMRRRELRSRDVPRAACDRCSPTTTNPRRARLELHPKDAARRPSPLAELSVRQSGTAIPASGSTQRNVPLPPKCPNVLWRVRVPDQCGAFPPLTSTPSPQSSGLKRPKSGKHAVEPGNCTRPSRRGSRARRVAGEEKLATDCQHVVEIALHTRAGMPVGVEAIPSGSQTAARMYSANRISARSARCSPRTRKPSVRVDAPPSGARSSPPPRKAGPEACASRCRTVEPGRPGRLVEVDDPFLGRDEHGERGHGLGDGGQPDRRGGVSPGRDRRVGARHPGRREGRVPGVDLGSACTGGDTSAPPWTAA